MEEARAAASRTSNALDAAESELASLRISIEVREAEIEALKAKQDRMQLTLQVRASRPDLPA